MFSFALIGYTLTQAKCWWRARGWGPCPSAWPIAGPGITYFVHVPPAWLPCLLQLQSAQTQIPLNKVTSTKLQQISSRRLCLEGSPDYAGLEGILNLCYYFNANYSLIGKNTHEISLTIRWINLRTSPSITTNLALTYQSIYLVFWFLQLLVFLSSNCFCGAYLFG